ncbi:MAG TPA: prenyltransferase/squalene oxidase repeat-containing protein, partial [Verrucomicrobiae bacterium]|nr:prenyltransferase/squalene oxidase repeat-containing protein [Verrucomicrobiae bacterium]
MSSAPKIDPQRLQRALQRTMTALLEARSTEGHWTGELSSSALSTATAVTALTIASRESEIRNPKSEIAIGLDWLACHANADGGWGDTTRSLSNLSTTALCWAAFGAVPGADETHRAVVQRAGDWLKQHAGGLEPSTLAPAIIRRYGKDRTFSAPILTMCALAGRLGPGREAWRHILPLPFELAACPHRWFAALRLPVVSYALPALIAIGQARHHHRPTRNPLTLVLRHVTRVRTLRVLTEIQPSNGGFLEATPLTSFVVMSLAGSGQAGHGVTKRGVEFLLKSQRSDGSWPIDTNLATWVTTLAVNALADRRMPNDECRMTNADSMGSAEAGKSTLGNWQSAIRQWLHSQQYRTEHPYTHAAPGGWAWTNLPGGVPDADDTAGAVLALRQLGRIDDETRAAAFAGIDWLLNVQNADGGIPTFCRGWGALPFDRSSADITAHALRAWLAWFDDAPAAMQRRIVAGWNQAIRFFCRTQRSDGAWLPLWFGNQFDPEETNPTYGTSRVLRALAAGLEFFAQHEVRKPFIEQMRFSLDVQNRATGWLVGAQRPDGGWGGGGQYGASVEETALA